MRHNCKKCLPRSIATVVEPRSLADFEQNKKKVIIVVINGNNINNEKWALSFPSKHAYSLPPKSIAITSCMKLTENFLTNTYVHQNQSLAVLLSTYFLILFLVDFNQYAAGNLYPFWFIFLLCEHIFFSFCIALLCCTMPFLFQYTQNPYVFFHSLDFFEWIWERQIKGYRSF